VLPALRASEDDLVHVGEGDVGVAVVEERRGGDLLGSRCELGTHTLLLEEAKLLGHQRRIEQCGRRCRQVVDDLLGAASAFASAPAAVVIVAAACANSDERGRQNGQ
jgi:hypothetical protein